MFSKMLENRLLFGYGKKFMYISFIYNAIKSPHLRQILFDGFSGFVFRCSFFPFSRSVNGSKNRHFDLPTATL